jgi:hypothetical protein
MTTIQISRNNVSPKHINPISDNSVDKQNVELKIKYANAQFLSKNISERQTPEMTDNKTILP